MIVGSSAGALTGLQFVTMALIADMPTIEGEQEAGQAFATPTVVHFGTGLLVAAILSAPWHGVLAPLVLCSVAGVAGLIYTLLVARQMRLQVAYKPVVEDWMFHVALPFVAYAVLAASATVTPVSSRVALFGVAASVLLLLLIGIHNAWDNVMYLVFAKKLKRDRI